MRRTRAVGVAAGLVLLVGLCQPGCNGSDWPRFVDLTHAHWTGRGNPEACRSDGWPLEAPWATVRINDALASWQQERLASVWDETGLYMSVYAYWFPVVEITAGSRADRDLVLVLCTDAGERYGGDDRLGAFRQQDGALKPVAKAHFRGAHRCWSKPGQGVYNVWLAWEALGTPGLPDRPVTIRVRDQILVLPGPRGHLGQGPDWVPRPTPDGPAQAEPQ